MPDARRRDDGDASTLSDALVRDMTGEPVGRVRAVLLDPDSLEAKWLRLVLTDHESEVLVPFAAASEARSGELMVPWRRDWIASAPAVTDDAVSEDQASDLRTHYGMSS